MTNNNTTTLYTTYTRRENIIGTNTTNQQPTNTDHDANQKK